MIAMTHVDDISFASTSLSLMNNIRQSMGRVYDLSIITDMSHSLPWRIDSLVEEFSIATSNSPAVPTSLHQNFDSLIASTASSASLRTLYLLYVWQIAEKVSY